MVSYIYYIYFAWIWLSHLLINVAALFINITILVFMLWKDCSTSIRGKNSSWNDTLIGQQIKLNHSTKSKRIFSWGCETDAQACYGRGVVFETTTKCHTNDVEKAPTAAISYAWHTFSRVLGYHKNSLNSIYAVLGPLD